MILNSFFLPLSTRRNLHTHKLKAPLTIGHFQVTCYGKDGKGDANDIFRIEILGGKIGDTVEPIRSKFKLIHQTTGCFMNSNKKQLPKWLSS